MGLGRGGPDVNGREGSRIGPRTVLRDRGLSRETLGEVIRGLPPLNLVLELRKVPSLIINAIITKSSSL